jgi:hypothetical protein
MHDAAARTDTGLIRAIAESGLTRFSAPKTMGEQKAANERKIRAGDAGSSSIVSNASSMYRMKDDVRVLLDFRRLSFVHLLPRTPLNHHLRSLESRGWRVPHRAGRHLAPSANTAAAAGGRRADFPK